MFPTIFNWKWNLSKIQPQDECPSACVSNRSIHDEMNEKMGAIGPWATGKCDWNPSSGLVGVKPVVDHYSVTRFSTQEWHQRNIDIFDENHQVLLQSHKYDTSIRLLTFYIKSIHYHYFNPTELRTKEKIQQIDQSLWSIDIKKIVQNCCEIVLTTSIDWKLH